MRSRVFVVVVLVTALGVSPVAIPLDQRAASPAVRDDISAAHEHSGPVPFESNGCTGFREAKFFSCCYMHDLAYWAGGTRSERRSQDLVLRRCLIDIGGTSLYDRIIADFGYLLVRMWAWKGFALGPRFGDGWGRAWRNTNHGRYENLTPDQRRIVDDQKQQICSTLTLNKSTGLYRLADSRELATPAVRRICGDAFVLPPH